jgi:hypothetical protein
LLKKGAREEDAEAGRQGDKRTREHQEQGAGGRGQREVLKKNTEFRIFWLLTSI